MTALPAVQPAATLQAALSYAALGFRVFPTWWVTERGGQVVCACGAGTDAEGKPLCNPGKHPISKGWMRDATTDPGIIKLWWRADPLANLSIATGAASKLFVLDIDGDEGRASLGNLVARHGEIPLTPRAVTGSGGWHFLFLHPGGHVKTMGRVAPGIDVRGDGGQIVAPPSIHLSGAQYRWIDGLAPGQVPVAPAPPWLLALLTEQPAAPRLRVVAPAQEDSEYQQAVARYNQDHRQEYPARRAPCPVCKCSCACWGAMKGDPSRWSCFNTDHPASGCGQQGYQVWHGDQLDLDAHAAGVKPLELLQLKGFLPRRGEGARREEPPPPTDQDAPPGLRPDGTDPSAEPPPEEQGGEGQVKERPLTDSGNAERLVDRHGRDLRYVKNDGWYVWGGTRWERSEEKTILSLTLPVVRSIRPGKWVDDIPDEKEKQKVKKSYENWARSSESRASRSNMVSLAAADSRILLGDNPFDQHPWLLNLRNGTMDLRTGEFRGHHRADHLTQLAPTKYNPKATCPNWLRFLEQVQPDLEVRAYLQRLAGYCLTGVIREQVFVVFHGGGRNGKGVYVRVLQRIMGTTGMSGYSANIAAAMLVERHNDPHESEYTRFIKARFAAAVEPKEGKKLDTAQVKRLTGGDPIPTAFKHEDQFEFIPTHKLVYVTNPRPRFDETNISMRARMQMVPWLVTFAGKEDESLEDRLVQEEASGILVWMLEGCRQWQASGLRPPLAVRETTSDLFDELDPVQKFLAEQCIIGPGKRCRAGDLFKVFTRWCADNDVPTLTQAEFGRALTDKGFRDHKSGERLRLGLELRAPLPQGPSPADLRSDPEARA